jgi:hypothetical protein
MRLRTLLLLLLLSLLVLSTARAEVPETVGGLRVVVLEGTHYERGYAHGKALHGRIVDLVDGYLVGRLPNPTLFFLMLRQVAPLLDVDDGLKEEARGLVQGALDANGGTFRSRYRTEDFTWEEILALNTYVDYIGTACSSVSAWGKATAGAGLEGGTVLARNLDWSLHPGLLRNQVLFVHKPAEAGEQPFVSVGFAGFLGCLSCMNGAGLGAFLNLGYGDRAGRFPPTEPFQPAALAFRRALETRPKADTALLDHFVAVLTGRTHVGSFILHAVAPAAGKEDPAVVVELQAGTHALRRSGDDARFQSPILVATNHNRKAAAPRACQRYAVALADAETREWRYDPDSLWKLLGRMARDDTMQRLLFVPATGELRISVQKANEKAWGKLRKVSAEDFTPVETTTLKALFGE